jgi:hypothetical protein
VTEHASDCMRHGQTMPFSANMCLSWSRYIPCQGACHSVVICGMC